MKLRAASHVLVWVMACGLAGGAVGCGGDDDGPPELDAGTDAETGGDAGGGGTDAGTDAGEGRDGAAGRCGDGVVDEGEDCDDGNTQNDDFCNRDCTNACGDGAVNAVETCDVGIESGEGSCPASCDDANACTTDVLDGVDCAATCLNAPISACVSGDGCCAAGCTVLDDDDCAAECGNGVLEPGELCDDGSEVSCPTDCDDGLACTTDALEGEDCERSCSNVAITACSATSDGCCAPGCNASNDADCSASCGNGVLEAGELCENGSAMPCPSSCNDGNACTTDALRGSAASCNAQCGFTAITTCRATSDGCCAPGCNATNDADCSPVCGNRVVEAGEDCDDGNMTPGDGCEACRTVVTPTAFRMNDLDLRDPHAFARVFGFCADITSTLNDQIQTAIQRDDDRDGFLDLSYLLVFRPLAQTAMTGTMEVRDGDCRTSTSCVGVSPVLATAGYRNLTTGTCLDTAPGGSSVVRPYRPAVATPTAPCFVSDAVDLTVTISGIPIRLRDAQIAGTYSGSPATSLSNGLLRGFISEEDAEATILPADLTAVGGMSLAAVLRGGERNCASGSDQDRHPTHGLGWWFFLNFPGGVVTTYSE